MSVNWSAALDVVQKALSVVAGAGDIPGVNLLPYVSIIASAAKVIGAGISAGKDVAPYIAAMHDTFAHGLPSQEKLTALDAQIKELEAIVYAPLPPADEGEPD